MSRELPAPRALTVSDAPAAHAGWLTLLSGSMLRHLGRDQPDPYSLVCRRLFFEQAQRLFAIPEYRASLGVLDWWLVAMGEDSPLGLAWHLDDSVGDPVLAPHLSELLTRHQKGFLRRLRAPIRRREIREELQHFFDNPPRVKKAPGPTLMKEAKRQVRDTLEALSDGRPLPAVDILEMSPAEFASQRRDKAQLQSGLGRVYSAVVKHAGFYQSRLQELISLQDEQLKLPGVGLPNGWRDAVEGWPLEALIHELMAHTEATLLGTYRDMQYPLEPSWVVTLVTDPPELEDAQRALLLAPAMETASAGGHKAHPWMEETQADLEKLRQEIRSLLQQCRELELSDAASGLKEALDELLELRIDNARFWRTEAEDQLNKETANEQNRSMSRQLSELAATLAELGEDVADLQNSERPIADRLARAREEVSTLRQHLREDASALIGQPMPSAGEAEILSLVEEANRALNSDRLPTAQRVLNEAESLWERSRAEEQAKLIPELQNMVDRCASSGLRSTEVVSFEALLARITDMSSADLEYTELVMAADELLDAAERGTLHELDILCEVSGGTHLGRSRPVHLLAWARTGVQIDPARARKAVLRDHELQGFQGEELFLAKLRRSWVDTSGQLALDGPVQALQANTWLDCATWTGDGVEASISPSYPAVVSDPLFKVEGTDLLGPIRLSEDGRMVPSDPRGFIVRLPLAQFRQLFGTLPTPAGRLVVRAVADIDQLLELEGAEAVDYQDTASTQRWLSELLSDLPDNAAAGIAKSMVALETQGSIPAEVLEQRLSRLSSFLGTSQELGAERDRAVAAFLESEDGKGQIDRAAKRLAREQTQQIEAQTKAELERIEAQLAKKQADLKELDQQHLAHQRTLEAGLSDLQRKVTAAEELLNDHKTQLLLELVGGGSGGTAQPPPDDRPIVSTFTPSRDVPSLSEAVTELYTDMETWHERDVANLLCTVLTNRWTLLAGPPGIGKSTFARSLLTRMGHGPDTQGYLELSVRSDWHDDAPLFGFWHPEKQAWTPSSEGMVEHLLKAAHAENEGHAELYGCLLEELNLAAPEHYMARLLSALEGQSSTMRLYGSELRTNNPGRYPREIRVPERVRFIGTVNVDDTVQRLSPRFLSRSAVIWLSPSMDALKKAPPPPKAPDLPLSWQSLQGAVPPPTPIPESILQLGSWLHEQRVSGAPTPRAIRGIERYLPAARSLMPSSVAEDYQVLQRILPGLRGVGERYRGVLDNLATRLTRNEWHRSAERCKTVRKVGEEMGDYYDFFHA